MHALKILATLALAATAYASTTEANSPESEEPLGIARVGCKQQGTPSRPAMCHKPKCPSNRRSVLWDYGCPDGSWKCCI
ncbi:unnamed protein product [Clonostachys chloroleuca]|uniref:Uncharacterized protein n=1 Tax=Clonostachys chloroleuca TaxID=1926264 RepID=A0AA35LZK5_9HYPO|nr:unnamed protein product [Clonostachys chloroleuca]